MADRQLKIIVDQEGNAQEGLDSLVGSLGSGIPGAATLAVGGLALVTGAVVGIGAASIEAWSQMDDGVDNFTTRTGVTGDALNEVQAGIERISESSAGVGQSLGTIGDVMGVLKSRLDSDASSTEYLADGMLKLSRITGEDAVQSSELFTRAMGDWGVSVDESGELLDKLTIAHQKTGVGVNDLMTKMVQFGAPMRQMGFSIEDSIALFGKWEKEGVNAELVMGSLRIAAGHFAKAETEATTVVKGGVKSLADSADKLAKLKDQLRLATIKQGEFTDKTKESTKVQSQMRIDSLTKDITELEAAMAKGEDTTVTTVVAQKSLRDSLMDTFTAIKGASSETEALGIAMEIFGAKAGPDMAAAIREGRFSIEDLVATLGDSEGALDKTADATLDFGDRFGLMKQKVMNSIVPIGQAIMDLGDIGLDFAGPAVDNLTGWIDKVTAKYQEGGIAGVGEMLKADLSLMGSSINTQVQLWGQEFWNWLDDVIARAPANFALLQNTIKTQIAFAWPGIKAELDTWPGKFWSWVDGAMALTDTSMFNLSMAIQTWVSEHGADISASGSSTGEFVYDGLMFIFTDPGKADTATSTWISNLGASMGRISTSIDTLGKTFALGFLTGVIGKLTEAEPATRVGMEMRNMLVRSLGGWNPATLFVPVGVAATAGVVTGIEKGIDRIARAARNAARNAYNAMMDYLRAGSPSELISDNVGEEAIGGGITQGIGRAANAIGASARAVLSPAVAMTGGGGLAMAGATGGNSSVVVQLTYAPTISTADEFELERVLTNVVNSINKKRNG